MGNKNYSKKIVWGCSVCCSQGNWHLRYCNASDSFMEQSPYELYWEGCESFWDWKFVRPWYMANSQLLKPKLFKLLLTTFLHTFHRYSLIYWMWDKSLNKAEIKTFVFLSINFHNLEIIFLLSLALIYANPQFGYPDCVHPYNIKIPVD